MMDCVLISIKPEWVKEILKGNKWIEVRKNFPKLKPPFKVYIYCTKNYHQIDCIRIFNGHVEFYEPEKVNIGTPINGKVVAEFICPEIIPFEKDDYAGNCYDISDDDFKAACIPSMDYYWEYGRGKTLYGWRINNINVYKEPYNIEEFTQTKYIRGYHKKPLDESKNIDIEYLLNTSRLEVNRLTRAPQSWCYCDKLSVED